MSSSGSMLGLRVEQSESWVCCLLKSSYTYQDISRAKMRFSARPSEDMVARYQIPGQDRIDVGMVWVEFRDDTKFGVKEMRDFAQTVSKERYGTGIIITPIAITANALKIIPTVLPSIIETFVESDLLINISRHELVPKHVVLSAEEKTRLLERYRLKETQLPRIQLNDPMARYLGLRRGQVVKIIRNSETAGRYASYRWCI
jgi:DNA-directed RNA polymerase I, II, and III subunit RPABC1